MITLQKGIGALQQARQYPENALKAAEAVHWFEQAGAVSSSDPAILRQLALAYRIQGRHADAIHVLEMAFRLQPSSVIAEVDLVRAYLAVGDTDRASKIWADLGGTNGTSILFIGDTYLDQGNPSAALGVYGEALDLMPNLATSRSFHFRRLLAAIVADSTSTSNFIDQLQILDPSIQVPLLGDRLVLSGGQMRWATHISDDVSYGTPLSYPYGQTEGTLWWAGRGTTLVQVSHPGRYRITVIAHNPSPASIHVSAGTDGRKLVDEVIDAAHPSPQAMTFDVDLPTGYHTIDVWFLNGNVADGFDRDAVIDQVTATLVNN
ncbi:hypothetical protein EKD04_013965 [Chloroflexales bacterium ZM16-3]|nr:hypothetical protein [Chloroflexales bacterium ZM16-3]